MLLDKDADDPWDPDRLAWPLLDVIDDVHGRARVRRPHHPPRRRRPRRRPLDPPLRRGPTTGRPVRLLRRAAPDADHRLARGPRHRRRRAATLDPDLRWQAELWRRLLGRVDATAARRPARRRRVERLRAGGADLDLPPRLSLFGHTRLPETEVALLRALGDAARRAPLAAAGLARRCGTRSRRPRAEGQVPRAADASADLVGHPLLGSLGRDSRELRRTLGDAPRPRGRGTRRPARHPARLAPARPARQRRARRRDPRAGGTGLDDSVQVHACHGAARQVDVLREVLVGLLARTTRRSSRATSW